LLEACEKEGGLKSVKQGGKTVVRIDPVKVRASLSARKKLLTPALRDALVAAWFRIPEEYEEAIAAVLAEMGQMAKDEKALGFATFFTGKKKERTLDGQRRRKPTERQSNISRLPTSSTGWLPASTTWRRCTKHRGNTARRSLSLPVR
jgi:hypothetical protein